MKTIALILAAGKGTRMKSDKPKVIHKLCGKEMIKRVVEESLKADVDEIIAVVGYKKEEVQKVLGDTVKYAYQNEMLGTGHAVFQAKQYLENEVGKVVILYGDVPLLKAKTIKKLIKQSIDNNEMATILTAIYDNPKGYGRIVRDNNGNILTIIEEKDASDKEKQIKEVNAGVYCFDIKSLLSALNEIKPNNNQHEYYLTDVIKIMNEKHLKIGSITTDDNTEIIGVNNKEQLKVAEEIYKKKH